VVFGVFWGGWAVAAADVEHDLGLGHGGFGLLLSVALAGAAAANAVGGALTERHGTDRVLATAFLVWGAIVCVTALLHGRVLFAVALVATVAAGGVVDVVMNVAATAGLAGDPGGLVRFHARFNAGAALGAAAVGLLLSRELSWRTAWLVTGALGIALGATLARRRTPLPAGGAGASVRLGELPRLLRREHLVLVAIAFAVGAMIEGGVELWGVLFLRRSLPSGLTVGASSAVAGYVVAATVRVVIGPYAGRRGAAPGVAAGAGAAVAGLVLLALSPVAVLAGAGLVLAAGGISLCWPLLLSLAAANRERPGAVIGAVTSVGYLGFVVGPSLVGLVSGAVGLRAGLLVLAGASVFVAVAPSAARK
jgi:MFS family permease